MFRLGHVVPLADGVEELQRDPGRPGQRPEHLLRYVIVDGTPPSQAHLPCAPPKDGLAARLVPQTPALQRVGLVPNVMDPSSQTSRQTTVRAVGPRRHRTPPAQNRAR